MYNKTTLQKVLMALFLMCTLLLFSQNKKILFEEFVIEDGLASVNCILKDKNGFMWFGGTHGLYRYDGYKFKVFTANSARLFSISNNNVISLFEDNDGEIWVGTMYGGLNRYNPKTEAFTNYKNAKNKIYNKNQITCISGDLKNTIWIGTFGNGMYSYDKKKGVSENFIHSKNTKKSISHNSVFSIVVDDNNVWITTNSGVLDCYHIASKSFSYFRYYKNKFQSSRTGQRLCLDSFHNLWIATENNGLYKFEISSKSFIHFEKNESQNSINSNNITDIKEGNPGEIWVTTFAGLNLLNTSTNKVTVYQNDIYNKHSITNNVSYCLLIDPNMTIWMGMGDGTVNKTINSPFEIYQTSFSEKPSSLSFNVVGALYMSTDYLWIGTGGGGLDKFNLKTNEFQNFKHHPKDKFSIPSNIVMTVIEDENNTVWTGIFKNSMIGYKEKNTAAFIEAPLTIKPSGIFYNTSIFDIKKDTQNNIWIATYNEGLYKYDKKQQKLRHYNVANTHNKLPTNRLISLLVARSEKIWIGSLDKGVLIYNPKNNHFNSLEDIGIVGQEKINFPIKDIYQDLEGIIWLATEGGGVFYIDLKAKTLKNINKIDGLPSNSIYGIIQDLDKNYWFSTNKGIVSYNPSNAKISIYNTSDGLPTNDFESGAIAKAKDGKLFFGSKKGLIGFYPKQLISAAEPINLMLTNLRVFNEAINVFDKIGNYQVLDSSITLKKSLKLPYYLDNFGFEFAVPGHSSPHNIAYHYKLEGIDNRWITTSSDRHFVNYSNIKHGSYTFKIKAFDENQQNINNIVETQIKIFITPVWWQTNSAYFIYSLLFLAFIYYIFNSIRDRVQLKNELLIEKYKHEKDEELHQSKINFFTTISHELRTSLTLILSPLHQLSRVKTNNKASNLIMTMNRNGQRLLSLINQILDFRKLESTTTKLNISKIDLKSFFNELSIPFYQYAKESNIQFQLTVSNSCHEGWIDGDKLEIIIYNLLSNAFKHTQNKIDVNVDLDEKDERLFIKIKDNGKGILVDEIDKIFQDFYQINNVEKPSKGSGIGLAITKNLIDIHLGTISVKSEPNLYTIFNITIPIAKSFYGKNDFSENTSKIEITGGDGQFETIYPSNYEPQENATHKKPVLLIIEDNFEIMSLIKSYFSENYKVETAPDGLEGCEKALKAIPDIIISDIMMPKMNGLEVCKSLKTDVRTSHIPIILLTARGSHTFQLEGFEYGADDYITKPFDLEILNLRIKNLLETRKILRETFRKEILLKPKDIAINNTDEMFIEKIMKIIEENISDSKFTVAKLSKEVGMSHSVLYRKIIALSGQNINEFIKTIKLSRAAQLILDSNFSINEISDLTGFSNPKYFSTCFKKKYSTTPTKYRDLNKN